MVFWIVVGIGLTSLILVLRSRLKRKMKEFDDEYYI